MKAKIHITLKNGVLDPQGKAIVNSLSHLGFDNVLQAKQGKYVELDINENDKAKAQELVDSMCKKLLANTVIENYRFDLEA
ncbi:MAG: phosphoribosylformylglycinamidine synthase subunit PurS [Pseudomonadota bacterium]